MPRTIYIVPRGTEVTQQVIDDATRVGATEVVVGIPSALLGRRDADGNLLVDPASLPSVFVEPTPPVTVDVDVELLDHQLKELARDVGFTLPTDRPRRA